MQLKEYPETPCIAQVKGDEGWTTRLVVYIYKNIAVGVKALEENLFIEGKECGFIIWNGHKEQSKRKVEDFMNMIKRL